MGDIFLSGQNQCHITEVKKSYICHTFHLRPKKVFWWVVGGGGGWKVTLVSVCVHFLKLLDTQTQKWTQSLTINWYYTSLDFTYVKPCFYLLQFSYKPFSYSLNNPKNEVSQNLKKLSESIHWKLDPKNGWIGLQPSIIEPKVLKPWWQHKNSMFQGALLAININQYRHVIHRWKGKP